MNIQMTSSGLAKLEEHPETNRRGRSLDLEAGVDYVVGDGDAYWQPFPDCPSTQSFRHTWILVRRRRAVVPSFAGAPAPRHRPGEEQRAAAIVMAYFHPWTLRQADAAEHVPYAGCLRRAGESWQDALTTWLDGRALCEEARRYVTNFLSVHRVRPQDEASEDGNSDDIVSDEELQVSSEQLIDALATRIGGPGRPKPLPELALRDGPGTGRVARQGQHRRPKATPLCSAT